MPSNDKIIKTIRYNGTEYVVGIQTEASSSEKGLMSAADKSKLDNITAGATNTTISATTPIIASASTGSVSLTHAASGPSSSGDTSKGDTSNQSPVWGESFKAISATVNKYGHTTALAEHTVTIPSSTATTSANGLMSSSDKSKLDSVTVLSVGGTAPISASTSDGVATISHNNSGVTAASKGDTSNQTPTWGATFKVPSGTVNATGHLTAFADHTVKIPNATATTSAAGLMSAADKTKLDGGLTIAGNSVAIGSSISADTLRTSLGLSNAMHFIGIATVAITDGSTTNPTIDGYTFGTNGASAKAGDVVIDKDSAYEFVWTGSK